MTRRVTDTSALIFLTKIGRLNLLKLGAQEVLVPLEVLDEIRSGPGDVMAQVEPHLSNWLRICDAGVEHSDILTYRLGKGEAAVLRQAVHLGIKSVVLDDMVARKVARQLGLEPVGTLGILLAARKRGLVESIKHEIECLKAYGFWISTTLEHKVLREAGEDAERE